MIRIVCLAEGVHGADLKVGRVIIRGIYFWRKSEVWPDVSMFLNRLLWHLVLGTLNFLLSK